MVVLAIAVRLAWVLAVPTVPVSDFAMYRESANYLSEFGHLDPGFIYMPGFVALLAWVKDAGGGLLAQKMLGVSSAGRWAPAALFALALQARWTTGDARRRSPRGDAPAGGVSALPARGRGGADLRAVARRRGDVERRRDRHAGGGAAGARARRCW